MNIILWLLFGSLVGWIASIVFGMQSFRDSIRYILIGALGAVAGGIILGENYASSGANPGSLLISAVVAVLVLFSYKILEDKWLH